MLPCAALAGPAGSAFLFLPALCPFYLNFHQREARCFSAGKDGYFVSEGFSRQLPLATAAHTAPTGPVTRLAGVVPLPGFQNRTQALTGASLGSPSFSPTFSRWHHGQLPLQVVIHRLLDEADGKSQGAIPNFPISSLYFCRFNTDKPFFLQLSNVLWQRC